jgi:signal transduction histidine kinase/CheY-like chemotaxis protein
MARANDPEETAAETSRDALIRAEQIRTVYKNTPLVLISNIAIPLLLLWASWNAVARPMALTWVALMLGLVALRVGLFIAYRRAAPSPLRAPRWGFYLIVSAFASGCLWGAAGVALTSLDSPEQFSLIMLTLAGLGAAAVISYAAYLPVFHAYFLPSLLPFVVTAVLGHTQIQLSMAIGCVMFVGAVSFFAFNQRNVLTQSLRLRFEKLDLVSELTVQKEAAERANTAKTRFLAAASHDLRQPLHAMGLLVAALKEKVRGADKHRIVSQLGASTEALRDLLNALLDISRLDAGVVHPRLADCSVQDLFERLAHDYAAEAAEKKLTLRFVPTRAWVRCDPTLLERIVRNLVSNAIRYTDRGGVVVGCRRCGELRRIEAWDSGVGIASKELNNIFHEFYQVGNPERDRSKGLGLGLAIAQRLARLLGHRIDVVSVPGKGSVFSLTVPGGTPVSPDRGISTQVAPERLRRALVVVIDDELAIREATQTLLSGWGCDTLLADSGDAALATLSRADRRPEVIIADYRLRDGETGVEVIERLKAGHGRDIPAIIVTGDTAPDRLREAQASGFYLLHKPIAPARLRTLLSRILKENPLQT